MKPEDLPLVDSCVVGVRCEAYTPKDHSSSEEIVSRFCRNGTDLTNLRIRAGIESGFSRTNMISHRTWAVDS